MFRAQFYFVLLLLQFLLGQDSGFVQCLILFFLIVGANAMVCTCAALCSSVKNFEILGFTPMIDKMRHCSIFHIIFFALHIATTDSIGSHADNRCFAFMHYILFQNFITPVQCSGKVFDVGWRDDECGRASSFYSPQDCHKVSNQILPLKVAAAAISGTVTTVASTFVWPEFAMGVPSKNGGKGNNGRG